MLRFETAGESHGECLVATINGLPAGIPISLETVNRELWRRQQGYGRGGRMKIETDRAEIVAGVRHSHTIGSPVAILIRNQDWRNWTEALPVEDIDGDQRASRRNTYITGNREPGTVAPPARLRTRGTDEDRDRPGGDRGRGAPLPYHRFAGGDSDPQPGLANRWY